jgi:hypothetical protein
MVVLFPLTSAASNFLVLIHKNETYIINLSLMTSAMCKGNPKQYEKVYLRIEYNNEYSDLSFYMPKQKCMKTLKKIISLISHVEYKND